MITILQNGKYRKISCECGCIYSFEIQDLDENDKVKCPECGKENSATVQIKK